MPVKTARGQNEAPISDEDFLDDETAGQGNDGENFEDEFEDAVEGTFEDEDEAAGAGEDVEAAPPQRQRRAAPAFDPRDVELERLRSENERLRQPAPQAQVQQGETDQAFEQRLAALEPLEQMNARLQRAEARHQQSTAYTQAMVADQLDRASYTAKAASDKRYAKYADEVERRHQAFLMGGPNQPPQLVARETILKMVIGERILGPVNRETQRRQQRQQRRADNQQVRPGSSRGDVGGQRERRPANGAGADREARRNRLENVEL